MSSLIRSRRCCTKEIVVLSGKGGTGKTTIVGSFAVLAKSKTLADCDVDAADLHLLLQPEIRETSEFWSGYHASIDPKKCTRCGLCQDICRFNAIKDLEVDRTACEGCNFCARICPARAISMKENLAGHWFISTTKYGDLVHAKLGIAQENSGKLVSVVRQQARKLAKEQKTAFIISDGPPGIGCPVISSLSGANLALLVTEPSLSGMHDLGRVIEVCRYFSIPVVVCINKFDINLENTGDIERFCKQQGTNVVSRIPFDNAVSEAIVNNKPLVAYSDGPAARRIVELWDEVSTIIDMGKTIA